LGDLCVYAGQLLIGNRMALRHVIDFADVVEEQWRNDEAEGEISYGSPIHMFELIGRHAHITLKHEQKIRGFEHQDVWRPNLMLSLASMFAAAKLAIEDEANDAGVALDLTEHFIANTYIAVAKAVVLKRNWTADRTAGGQTPG
jgi:hypothetical protein